MGNRRVPHQREDKGLAWDDLRKYMRETKRKIATADGGQATLPDPDLLEQAVDATFVNWAPGNFDSTIDLVANPAQIPDSFTRGDYPYGWSGFAAAGPFKGLSSFSSNVHAQNSNPLAQAEASRPLFGLDKEVYVGTILQNAANPKYRFDPHSGRKPSRFFAGVDPTPGVPGVNEMIKPPTFPNVSAVAPDGLYVSSPGYRVGEQVNAMAAWQNTLDPPQPAIQSDPAERRRGRQVFVRAGCIRCHAGEALTNNRVIPAPEIKTEPSRATALKKTGLIFGEPLLYSPDTPVPVPDGARVVKVPVAHADQEQTKLSFAHGDSPGGYKVPGLIGLYWTAPYLHDGGVAVGADPKNQLGLTGTLLKGIQPDPANSLRALVDRQLREQVIQANRRSRQLRQTHVQGIGHEFWVDSSTGFTQTEQLALIRYLLSLSRAKAVK